MKYLIAGLGNIGEEYQNTRHNIGFTVLDAFAEASGSVFSPARYGDTATAKHKGRQVILLKPSTYMNRSGNAVRYWMKKENIPTEKLLVITDDIALPFGTLRLKPKGGDGGHNGLASTIQLLGGSNFARLRFGIGNEFSMGAQSNYVLGRWDEEEEKALPERVEKCTEIIRSFVSIGAQLTMTQYNNK